MIEQGDDLASLFIESLKQVDGFLYDGDIIVVAQKIISKTEGRAIDLADIEPSSRAHARAGAVRFASWSPCQSIMKAGRKTSRPGRANYI